MEFDLHAPYEPTGDQPKAIAELVEGIKKGYQHQVLLGATGTGKTFTVANVIQEIQLPTLVMAHNKTLAAQLYAEFKEFFPNNAVEFFVSYYDYYQPEAYVPQRDLYIEKETDINEEIDRLRLAATTALMSRKDVIIVASVSAILRLGRSRSSLSQHSNPVTGGEIYRRNALLRRLVESQYSRNDFELKPGSSGCVGIPWRYCQPMMITSLFELVFLAMKSNRSSRLTLTGEILTAWMRWTFTLPSTISRKRIAWRRRWVLRRS